MSRSATAAEACADALREALLRGEVPPHARLPAERDLAVQLGVDRGTLRAGLQRLVAQGLLVQRQGRGTEATDFLDVGGLDLISSLVRGASPSAAAGHLADLLRLRRHLAGAVLETLVEYPPNARARAVVAERARRFADIVRRRAAGGEVHDDEVAAADMAVLAAVVACTERPVMRLAFNPVAALFLALPRLRAAVVADAHASVPAYEALLDWLAAPTPDGIPALHALLSARDAEILARVRSRSTGRVHRRTKSDRRRR